MLEAYRHNDELISMLPRVRPDPVLRDRILSSPEYLELTESLFALIDGTLQQPHFTEIPESTTRQTDRIPQQSRLTEIPENTSHKIEYSEETQREDDKPKTLAEFPYDIALSYASEDLQHAETLADILKNQGIKVFYDKYEKSFLWGKDLHSHLLDVYQNQVSYCVVFISKNYAVKMWTKHELRAAQARAMKESREYILPIRLDDTNIPSILPTTSYLEWNQETPETIAVAIMQKLGLGLSSTSQKTKEQLTVEGNMHYATKHYQEALVAYDQAIQLDPNFALAYSGKGIVLLHLKRYQEALTAYNKHIQLVPSSPYAYNDKGVALFHLKHYQEALTAYDQAIQLDPYNTDTYINKGIVLFHLERCEEALGIFDQAIYLNPSYIDTYINKGKALFHLERCEEALGVFDQAIYLDPNSARAYQNKGKVLNFLYRKEEALICFEKAIQLDPKESSFF